VTVERGEIEPASFTHCIAAASANWLTRSSMRSFAAGKSAAPSKATCAPIRQVEPLGMPSVERPMPERPFASASKKALHVVAERRDHAEAADGDAPSCRRDERSM
jgi:hypothetical protein